MRRTTLPIAATLLLAALSGCWIPPAGMAPVPAPSMPGTPTPESFPSALPSAVVSSAPSASAAPSAAPSGAPSAAAPAPAGLSGVATYDGAPFADAEVTAYLVGTTKALGTTTTDAQGRYALTPATELPAGALVQVVVAKGDLRLSAVGEAKPAAAYVLAATGATASVSEATTLAVAAFYGAFAAAEKARQAGADDATKLASDAFQAYTKVYAAAQKTLPQNRVTEAYLNGLISAFGTPTVKRRLTDPVLRTFLDGLAADVEAVAKELKIAGSTSTLEGRRGGGSSGGGSPSTTGLDVTITAPDDGDLVAPVDPPVTIGDAT